MQFGAAAPEGHPESSHPLTQKSNQSPLIYKGCLGTRETLIDLFNECAAVLILDVHNEFDDEAYLLFESESLGEFERITETDIR
jgi:hypothetical protein